MTSFFFFFFLQPGTALILLTFNKHLNTVMVEIHQLCSLRAPERDTLLSSDVGLGVFSELGKQYVTTHSSGSRSCSCGFGKKRWEAADWPPAFETSRQLGIVIHLWLLKGAVCMI